MKPQAFTQQNQKLSWSMLYLILSQRRLANNSILAGCPLTNRITHFQFPQERQIKTDFSAFLLEAAVVIIRILFMNYVKKTSVRFNSQHPQNNTSVIVKISFLKYFFQDIHIIRGNLPKKKEISYWTCPCCEALVSRVLKGETN